MSPRVSALVEGLDVAWASLNLLVEGWTFVELLDSALAGPRGHR